MIDDHAAERLYPSSPPQPEAVKPATQNVEEARALRMFKSSMPQPVSEAAATLATDDAGVRERAPGDVKPPAAPTLATGAKRDFAAEIKANTPREIAELRQNGEDARAEALYGETPHDAIVAAVTEDTDTPIDLRRPEVAVEWSKIARDIGIDDADTRYVTQRIGQLRLERAAGETPITREAALKSTLDALGRHFDDPIKAFNEAAKLARRDPRVTMLLDRTGLGNDAETIVMLAKRAMSERGRGRLK